MSEGKQMKILKHLLYKSTEIIPISMNKLLY